MIEVKLKICEVDYDKLAEKFLLSKLEEKKPEAEETEPPGAYAFAMRYVKKGVKLAGQAGIGLVPQGLKEDAAIFSVAKNREKIKQKCNEAAREHGIALTISDLSVTKK